MLGFFKKLFTPKNEMINTITTKEVSFTSPTYIYKTAKEKSKEPISEDQQIWIDRYDKKACPNCGSLLVESPKSDRKCITCGEKIFVRSHFQKKDKKVLLRADEKELFEIAKKQYFDERWCVRELSFINVSEKQYLRKKQELGPAFSSFDVMKTIIDHSVLSTTNNGNSVAEQLNFERTRLLLYMKNFEHRGFTEDAYYVLLHLILRDVYYPFSEEGQYELVPAFSGNLISYKEKLGLNNEVIKEEFRKTNDNHFGNVKKQINLSRLDKELDKILADSK